jgi:hypothetical protein
VSRKAPGAAAKLSQAQMAELRELVIAGPDREVHKVIRWCCVDLCAEVTRRFSVTVPERTIGKWLRKLKLTQLQPRPQRACRTYGSLRGARSNARPYRDLHAYDIYQNRRPSACSPEFTG